jgi:hypothetical protein
VQHRSSGSSRRIMATRMRQCRALLEGVERGSRWDPVERGMDGGRGRCGRRDGQEEARCVDGVERARPWSWFFHFSTFFLYLLVEIISCPAKPDTFLNKNIADDLGLSHRWRRMLTPADLAVLLNPRNKGIKTNYGIMCNSEL